MKKFTSDMVDEYAEKILVGLKKEENKMVLDEFDIIDKRINMVNDIPDLDKAVPMTHCLDDFVYELTEDTAEPSIPTDSIFQNCDDYIDTEVKVPKVVG